MDTQPLQPIDFGTTESDLVREKAQKRAELGIGATPAPLDFGTTESEMASKKARIRGFLTEIEKQIPLVSSGVLPQGKFQSLVDEAKSSGVSVELLKRTLLEGGVSIVNQKDSSSQ